MRREVFEPGDLVLLRNSRVEQEANRKSKPRYLGPYKIVRRTRGGSYVLQELDGAYWRQTVAAFRLLPYITRNDPILDELASVPDEEDPLPLISSDTSTTTSSENTYSSSSESVLSYA